MAVTGIAQTSAFAAALARGGAFCGLRRKLAP
jgi:hypothetical protein